MNGLDKITQKIISDMTEQAKQCEQEATSKIEALKGEAMDQIMRLESIYISRAEKLSDDIITKAESSSTLEARDLVLKKKSEMIELAFENAVKKILSMPKEEYISFISDALVYAVSERKNAKEGIRTLYGDEEAELDVPYEVIFGKRDIENGTAKAIFDRSSGKIDKSIKFVLSSEVARLEGGFILRCNDIETNCSVTSLVQRARKTCQERVIRELF